MVQSMRPEQSCNALAETDAELAARLAEEALDKALKDLAEAFADLDAKTKAADQAARDAADNPDDADKQKAADDAKSAQDQAQAKYDAASDAYDDASDKYQAANKAQWDDAAQRAKDWGSDAMTAGLFAAAMGNEPLAVTLELAGATLYVFGRGIEAVNKYRFKDCLLPVQPTTSTGIGYLVQSKHGPSTGVVRPETSQTNRNPPNWG